LVVDDYPLLETKSDPDATILTVFRETDKYLRVVRVSDDGVCYETGKPVPADFEVDEDDEEIEVGYAAPGWVIRDRLEVMGFTLTATRNVFGEDVLRREDGTLTPVVWRNFEDATGAYHGELANKAALQAKFTQKLASASADAALLDTLDWTGMKLILSALIGAFANQPTSVSDY
jgi:hypothetical protein